jgi:hypothetical protein
MKSPRHFKIDQPSVISETIDGEAVILDLRSGAYYSTRATGAEIWTWLEAGASIEAIIAHLSEAFPGEAQVVGEAAETFIGEMIGHRLLVPDPTASPPSARLEAPAEPFATPVLERYTDMDDLLMLDPIHDVDLAGWPTRKPDTEAE